MSVVQAQAEARAIARALSRLQAPEAVLARIANAAGFGVFGGGDRRRRPLARLSEEQARALISDGAVEQAGDAGVFVLSAAGAARAARSAAAQGEAYLAQHMRIVTRTLMDADGDARDVRGGEAARLARHLSRLRDVHDAAWLTPAEIEAAQRLRADWEAGQVGLVRGSDWSAPPQSGAGRGPGNGREGAMAAGLDARARVEAALQSLAAPARRVLTAICIEERSFEAFERAQNWPPRSAKVALKMALAQLADRRR